MIWRSRVQQTLPWLMALLLVWILPGSVWKSAPVSSFPWSALPWILAFFGVVILLVPLVALVLGPSWAQSRALILLEAPPEFLWGGLLLSLWPSSWGPPGPWGFGLALLLALIPGEVMWMLRVLPPEHPLPAAYGPRALHCSRQRCLSHLWGRWIAARLPLWLAGTLVLEKLFGFQGLGSDWMERMVARDRPGLSAWILVLALFSWMSMHIRKSRS